MYFHMTAKYTAAKLTVEEPDNCSLVVAVVFARSIKNYKERLGKRKEARALRSVPRMQYWVVTNVM